MGLYRDHLLPRVTNIVLAGDEFAQVRRRVTAGLEGEVLEVGFGSGLNVPFYPAGVRRALAVDPATAGRKLAAKRVAASPVPVEYVGLNGEVLPLGPDCVDYVLVTWALCTIPDVAAALTEMRRVLRPGGQLHFAEHGLSPEPKVAAWQDRLTPLQRRLAGGCHLNRPVDRLITEAGFTLTRLDNFYMSRRKSLAYMFEGVATKA